MYAIRSYYGFKVLKLADSNFKQWQQINGRDTKALEVQLKLFIDPVAEHATIENMVYELLLKSGKDLNSKIEKATNYFVITSYSIHYTKLYEIFCLALYTVPHP